jgi:hypothetical protein
MTWEAWAAIGQLASALGVIASLVFVGVQVRQSVRTAKATAFQTLISSIIDVNMTCISQPGFLELVERNRKGEASDPEEHRVYVIFVLTAARLAQSAHYQMRLGLLNELQLESVIYNLLRHLNTPAGSAVWSELAKRSDPEFCRYVEALTERIDSFDNIMTPHP